LRVVGALEWAKYDERVGRARAGGDLKLATDALLRLSAFSGPYGTARVRFK
jgi:hypothetical protein